MGTRRSGPGLIAEKLAGRQRSSIASHHKAVGFPTGKTFEAWDESIPLSRTDQAGPRTLEWVTDHEDLVICGPAGTGKGRFLDALGQTAIDAGYHVSWFSL